MANKGVALSHVVAALEEIAPTRLAEDWDNVGLLAGDLKARVRKVLLCIDMMPPVVAEAVRGRHHLVVSYHPPIFRPITRLVEPSDRMEAGLHRCIRKGIAVYTPHTALDVARGGTNDVLAAHCGVDDATPIPPPGAPRGEPVEVGIGRMGALGKPQSLHDLARRLKRRTGARCVSIVGDGERTIKRAIMCVGAAGSLPFQVRLQRSDVIVTGEIRHHDALRILRSGCSAIALSHWSSERPALASLADRLCQAIPALSATLSEADCEPFIRV